MEIITKADEFVEVFKRTGKRPDKFMCSKCKKEESVIPEPYFTTGYGSDSDGNLLCYSCCAEGDKEYMRKEGKISLYLTGPHEKSGLSSSTLLSNWPGSLKIRVYSSVRKGDHNIAGCRYDVWFKFEGDDWHGVQYGDNTQLCHCHRLKKKEEMDSFVRQYLATLLWTQEMDDKSAEDFSSRAIAIARIHCIKFKQLAEKAGINLSLFKESTVAHDFLLTRNHHGAGFWDGDYPKEIGEELTRISHLFTETRAYKINQKLGIENG